MKGSCTLVASVLAASTVALSSSSNCSSPSAAAADGDVAFYPWSSNEGVSPNPNTKTCAPSSDKEKFAPRFDGLRFVETLVTAHR